MRKNGLQEQEHILHSSFDISLKAELKAFRGIVDHVLSVLVLLIGLMASEMVIDELHSCDLTWIKARTRVRSEDYADFGL